MSQASSPVSFGVGIDTARYGHHVSFLDEQKRTAAKAFHFTESAAGYQQFQAALTKLAEKHPGLQFHIRLDAAGQSADPPRRTAVAASLAVFDHDLGGTAGTQQGLSPSPF